ncbi:MAG: GHKL domain-containing protein, partial [Lachnospiraceae bacterium]
KISVETGDMGVLYGNLLDNAIEANNAVELQKRHITVETRYQEGKLLLKIVNSKLPKKNPTFVTSKVDKWKHGRGIHSVRKVAEKYGGNLILHDNGEEFEAILLLTDIEKLE